MMEDSGNVTVNVEDAVLSGKVTYRGQESVLLLMPGLLSCKEFATNVTGLASIPPFDPPSSIAQEGFSIDRRRISSGMVSSLGKLLF